VASITLRNVQKRYPNGVQAVQDANLVIEDGQFLVLVGPSGCGKSTILRMIAGLEEVSTGEIYINDRLVNHVEPGDRDIAMVFQNYALYPHMTVRQNLAFGLRMRRTPRDVITQRVNDAAEILSIENLLDRRPRELSGGQRQRVAVGRAIVRQPYAFLFDEPLSNLDAKLRVQMRTEIARLHHRLKTTMVYVTHDQVEAMTLGQRIVIMKDGVIQQAATPMDLYTKPANRFVGGFIGSPAMNFVSGQVAHGVFRGTSCVLDLQHDTADGEVILGIRPEHLSVESDLPTFATTTVELVECMGHETMLYFRIDGAQSVCRLDANVAFQTGDSIRVSVSPGGWHLFEPHGNQVRRSVSDPKA
jgi:multiple sugar transport system ATP-binding protein